MKVLNGENNEPQMNAPSRACLRHALRTAGRIHVCPRAYVSMLHGEHDADECRFTIQSPQRTQSTAILAGYIEVQQERYRTRIARIRRISTDTAMDTADPCVSVSSVLSVFYRNISAPTRAHPRLISIKAIGGT